MIVFGDKQIILSHIPTFLGCRDFWWCSW